MELRILRENVELERLVGSGKGQASVEGEITLPGGLREEAHVLQTGAMMVITGAEALSDRVAIEGKVVFHVLYTQGDPTKIAALEASTEFSHAVEVKDAAPRMIAQAGGQVEHAEASAYNGRLSLRSILALEARALSATPAAVVTGMQDVPGLEGLSQTLTLQRTVGEGSAETLLRDEFDLPNALDIRETLYGTAQAMVQEVSGGEGKANVTGTVQLEVYHASNLPARPLVLTRHTLPFEQAVDLGGQRGDLLTGEVVVKDVAVLSQDGGDTGRILRAEVLLGVSASVDKKETATVWKDAYTTTGEALALTVKPLSYRVGNARYQTAESGKVMIMLPEGSPPARTMLAGFARPILTGWEQIGGRLNAEGLLEVTLLYMTDDSDVPVTVNQEEPFRVAFACEAEPADWLTLEAGNIDVATITSDRVEMKYILRLTVDGARRADAKIISDVKGQEAAIPTGGISLYFAQPGDTLWDIAKRYRVPRQQLIGLNPSLTDSEVPQGTGVVVWRRDTAN